MMEKKFGWESIFSFAAGALFLTLATIAFLYPGFSTMTLINFLLSALAILGFVGIVRGLTMKKLPGGRRMLELALGITVLLLALTGLIYAGWSTIFKLYLIASALALMGIQTLFVGIAYKQNMLGKRIASIVFGLIILIISTMTFWNPDIGISQIALLFSFSLLLLGAQSIASA